MRLLQRRFPRTVQPPAGCVVDPLEARRLLAAAPPTLVQDINPSTEGSDPQFLSALPIGRAAFFRAETNSLYGTDATAAGTRVIRESVRLVSSTHVGSALTASAGGSSFFVAEDILPDGTNQNARLWRTDGTAAGTAPVFALPTGDPTHYYLAAAGGTIYLATGAESVQPDGTFTGHGPQLWRYNPGSGAMSLVREFPTSNVPTGMVDYRGKVYFAAHDTVTRRSLWATDGTPAGTFKVNATGPGADMHVASLPVAAGDYLYFAGSTAAAGTEPWRSDGTAAGTVQVGNIAAGTASSNPNSFAALPSGEAVFTAGGQLYKANANGTYVLIFAPGNFNPVYDSLYRAGNTVYIRTTERNANPVLWKTDGTNAGTVRVADTSPNDSNGSGVRFLGELNGKLLFSSFTTGIGEELWSSDGTTAGTGMVLDINPTLVWGPAQARFGSSDPSSVVVSGGRAFFAANDGVHGREPFVTDGTAGGTRLIADLNVVPIDSDPGGAYAGSQSAAVLDGVAYFPTSPSYLTRSDGTSAGTRNLARYVGGSVKHVTAWNGSIYFVWESPTGHEVVRYGGGPGAGDVSLLFTSGSALTPRRDFFVPFNGKLYFFASNALWSTDGTAAGTVRVTPASTTLQSPNWLTAAGDELFFVANNELWVSNGTAAGTRRFSAVAPSVNTQNARELMAIGNVLYYSAGIGGQPTLYRTDGTEAGTMMLAEPTPTGPRVSFWAPTSLTAVGGTLYFFASSGTPTTSGLWKSDGTRAGTVPVLSADAAERPSSGRWITAAGNRIYFVGLTAATGWELWTSDGTSAGTRRLSDINPGPADAFATTPDTAAWHLFAAGEHLFFVAQDGTSGRELWEVSDQGQNVRRVGDVYPGATGSDPRPMTVVRPDGAPVLLFSAADPVHGRELWRADAGPLGPGVAGRHVFYNGSAFDGGDTAADERDDLAIAVDKRPLAPGQVASFSNVTSYTRGINGLMVDIAGLPAGSVLTADDFSIRTGRGGNPSAWTAGPAPTGVTIRRTAGASGTDRVTLTFAEGAIRNTWIQVTVNPTPRTGLAEADVFYFGNLVGDTGGAEAPFSVDAADAVAVRAGRSAAAPVTSLFDFDRDGRVNATDALTVLRAQRHSLPVPEAASISVASSLAATARRRSAYAALLDGAS